MMSGRWCVRAGAGLLLVAGLCAAALPAGAAGACLTIPMVFETETVTGCPDAATLDRLMDTPIAAGPHVPETGRYAGAVLTDPDDPAVTQNVRTCTDYAHKVRAGWYPATPLQADVAGFIGTACRFLQALKASAPATSSRVDVEGMGLRSLFLLPPDILPTLAPTTRDNTRAPGYEEFTIGEMVRNHEVLTRENDPEWLELAYEEIASTYGELARGDFNGDGAMDLLIYAVHEPVHEGERWYELFGLAFPPHALRFERFELEGTALAPQP